MTDCCFVRVDGVDPSGGPPPGTLRSQEGGAGTSENIAANRTVDTPTIGAGIEGASNLQSESGGGFGVFAPFSSILSGIDCEIFSTADRSVIGGGEFHVMHGRECVIGGGSTNTISQAGSQGCTIGGGFSNLIAGDAFTDFATIGGGNDNTVSVTGPNATIGGGTDNVVSASGATVAGGSGNQATGMFATCAGGFSNRSLTRSSFTAGEDCRIGVAVTGGQYGTALGRDVDVDADHSHGIGRRVRVTHAGCWIFGDDNNADKVSNRAGQAGFYSDGGFFYHTGAFARGTAGDPGNKAENFTAGVQTTDATATDTVLATLATNDRNMKFSVFLTAQRANPNGGECVSGIIEQTAFRDSLGVIALVAPNTSNQQGIGGAGWTAQLAISGNDVVLRVTGTVAQTVNWSFRWTRQLGGFAA